MNELELPWHQEKEKERVGIVPRFFSTFSMRTSLSWDSKGKSKEK